MPQLRKVKAIQIGQSVVSSPEGGKVDSQYVNVYKTFFLHTLDINHTVVDTSLRKSISKENVSGTGSLDKTGKHTNRLNKIPVIQFVRVKNHISSFPKINSHYCCKDSSKSYLEPGLQKVYKLYLEHCTQNDFYLYLSILIGTYLTQA